MTYFPKYLTHYPNMNSTLPLHMSINRIEFKYPAHRHDFLEFSYVIEGSGEEWIDGKRHAMKPGTFTFVLPYQVHEILSAPGQPIRLYNSMFSMDLLMPHGSDSGLSGLLADAEELAPFYAFEGAEEERMRSRIDLMFEEYEGDGLWRTAMIQSALTEILVLFDRSRRRKSEADSAAQLAEAGRLGRPIRQSDGTVPQGSAAQAEERARLSAPIWPVIHDIHRNYREELSLSGLARQYGFSVSYLSECIKKTTGQSFVPFLHDVRIRHACGLLNSTEMSIAEIALEVGYGSYKTFSKTFRERKGIHPTEYRKRKRTE